MIIHYKIYLGGNMSNVYEKVMEFKRKYPGGIYWRLKSHSKVVEEFLNPNEEVLYAFPAQKNDNFKEIFNTFVIAVTNKRLLLGHKRLFWGSFYYTITPDLYNDLQVLKGLIWGKITIDTVKEVVVLTNLPNSSIDEIETIITTFMMETKKKNYHEKDESKAN
jgi:hypothetical protein